MARLAIVGGGIAGLAAAWAARQAGGPALDIVVLERDAEPGGKARTVRSGGWRAEGGPAGAVLRPELQALIESAGLSGEVIPARPESRHRFLYVGGRPRRVTPNPVALVGSGVLSARGAARLLAEPFVARHGGGEESIRDFAARRLGAEAAERLIMPMTIGVFAGDARALSVDAAFPRMRALEREHGSLVRGLVARRGRMAPPLVSFRGGMQRLPLALAERGSFTVQCNTRVRAVERTDAQWRLHTDAREPLLADAIVLAGESWSMSELVSALDPTIAANLAAIQCPPVTVVALGYGPGEAARVPRGFGVLVARGERVRMLGGLWESQIFPGRAPDGHLLMRAMYGGTIDSAACAGSEQDALALAREDMTRCFGIVSEPVFSHVVQWPAAIPQYTLGHQARVAAIERRERAIPAFAITGNALRGVSFADTAADGWRTGETMARRLRDC